MTQEAPGGAGGSGGSAIVAAELAPRSGELADALSVNPNIATNGNAIAASRTRRENQRGRLDPADPGPDWVVDSVDMMIFPFSWVVVVDSRLVGQAGRFRRPIG